MSDRPKSAKPSLKSSPSFFPRLRLMRVYSWSIISSLSGRIRRYEMEAIFSLSRLDWLGPFRGSWNTLSNGKATQSMPIHPLTQKLFFDCMLMIIPVALKILGNLPVIFLPRNCWKNSKSENSHTRRRSEMSPHPLNRLRRSLAQ